MLSGDVDEDILILTTTFDLSKSNLTTSFDRSKSEEVNTTSEFDPTESTTLIDSSSPSNESILRRYQFMNHVKELSLRGRLRRGFVIEATLQDSLTNVVCSPISAMLPLGKLSLGAVGESQDQLKRAMGVSSSNEISNFKTLLKDLQYLPGVNLTIAIRIYVSEGVQITDKFTKEVTDIFQSGIESMSFSDPTKAANEINAWVSNETNGMIPTVIDPGQITNSTSMIIINAIYLKGKWKYPFKEVKVENFYAATGIKKVQMMNQKRKYNYAKSNVLNAQVVEIPYQGSKASLLIVLPFRKSDLPVLLNQLKFNPDLLKQALVTSQPRLVNLTIPKFKITSTLDLKRLYYKIGINQIFEKRSGLSGIVNKGQVHVTSAFQTAVIEVHETGTDAGAASYVTFVSTSLSEPINVNANHPFLFYVIANKEPLFGGSFVDP